MKKILFLIIALSLSNTGLPQSCLPNGITFTTQSQIDSFPINYPNCTQIEGSVMISVYSSDISNLNGLSNLVSIGGHLAITNNTHLTNLIGLGSLKHIGGTFFLHGNSMMTSFTGLDSLQYIGGYIDIYDDNRIKDLVGLESLRIVKEQFWVRFNDSLTSLTGIENLVADSLAAFWADDNPMLTNCAIKCVCDYINLPFHHADFYWNSTGCNSEYEVEDACAGLYVGDLYSENEIGIFPNPASTSISLQKSGIFAECDIRILNLTGKELLKYHINNLKTPIDIRELSNGIYFVRITNQFTVENIKMIKN